MLTEGTSHLNARPCSVFTVMVKGEHKQWWLPVLLTLEREQMLKLVNEFSLIVRLPSKSWIFFFLLCPRVGESACGSFTAILSDCYLQN